MFQVFFPFFIGRGFGYCLHLWLFLMPPVGFSLQLCATKVAGEKYYNQPKSEANRKMSTLNLPLCSWILFPVTLFKAQSDTWLHAIHLTPFICSSTRFSERVMINHKKTRELVQSYVFPVTCYREQYSLDTQYSITIVNVRVMNSRWINF